MPASMLRLSGEGAELPNWRHPVPSLRMDRCKLWSSLPGVQDPPGLATYFDIEGSGPWWAKPIKGSPVLLEGAVVTTLLMHVLMEKSLS
jgi:hypothetical protein